MSTKEAFDELQDLVCWMRIRIQEAPRAHPSLNQKLHRQRQERQAEALEVALDWLAKVLKEQEGK